jgi:hypothetical protein
MKTKNFKTLTSKEQKHILGGYNRTEIGKCLIDGKFVDWDCNQACPSGVMPFCLA